MEVAAETWPSGAGLADNLRAYIEAAKGQPFQWGANDCLTFANRWAALNGRAFASDWLGGYTSPRQAAARYARLRKDSPHSDIIEGVDARLDRLATLHPPNGAIAARKTDRTAIGYAFGVVCGGQVYFVGPDGLAGSLPQAADMFWSLV